MRSDLYLSYLLTEDERWPGLFEHADEIVRWADRLRSYRIDPFNRSISEILGNLFYEEEPMEVVHPKDWFPRNKRSRSSKFNWDDAIYLLDIYRETQGEEFPKLWELLSWTLDRAVETALTPGPRDLQLFFGKAVEEVNTNYRLDLGLWESIASPSPGYRKWTEDSILESILNQMRMTDQYSISFHAESSFVLRALKRDTVLSEREMYDGYREECEHILKDVVNDFFRIAKYDTENFDVGRRLDFFAVWGQVLQDESKIAPVRNELTAWLSAHPTPARRRP